MNSYNNELNDCKKKIFFISSYPKSGNTWLRCIIGGLLNKKKGLFDFKDLNLVRLFSRESNFQHFKDIKYQKNGNLNFNFVSNRWIDAQKKINSENDNIQFFKTHSIREVANRKFTDETVCLGFIYIIRDPRDVAISYTNHCGGNINVAIETMLFNEKNYSSYHKTNELISTWKKHLYSWTNFNTVPRLFIKYEDMIKDRKKALLQIIDFINTYSNLSFCSDESFLNNILQTTKIEYLQEMEKSGGFIEATKNNPFFRQGTANQWKSTLSKDQIKLIENELDVPMRKLGYIDM